MTQSPACLTESSPARSPASGRVDRGQWTVPTASSAAPARPNNPETFHLGYRPVLDGLRGLAILAVMVYHSNLRAILSGGFLGVDLFFVLSGFLVTVMLLHDHQRSGAIHLQRFYLRRILRLLPALVVMLAACCAFAAFRMKPDQAQGVYQAVILTACFGANWDWFWSIPLGLLGHVWSLSLEEQFYIVWPLVLALLLRFRVSLGRVVWLIVLGMAATALFRAVLWTAPWPPGPQAAATRLPARADSLLAGCLVGVLAGDNRLPHWRGGRTALQALAAASALFLLCLGFLGQTGASFLFLGGYAVVAVAGAALIAALIHAPPQLASRILSTPALVWIGRISYGLYLWHFPMLSFAPKLIHGILPVTREVPGLTQTIAFALTFAAAALSFYAVERPFLRWKNRFGHV